MSKQLMSQTWVDCHSENDERTNQMNGFVIEHSWEAAKARQKHASRCFAFHNKAVKDLNTCRNELK